MKKKIGHILSGSLIEGLTMRLEPACAIENIKTGKFISIPGENYTFFSLITNLELKVTNPDILLFPPSEKESLLLDQLKKRDIYATVQLRPMLMLDKAKNRMPVKTVPPHFTPVYEATQQDVYDIFGDEQISNKYFNIGTPLDMNTPVCINLDLLVERSNGIFGRTGTGKTFFTRLILAALIKNEKAVNLIFDMHSEYGLQARKEGSGESFVKGLKTLFPNKVSIFSLDPTSTRRRGGNPDVEVLLNYQDIRVDDVMSLQDELNLHPTAIEAAYLISSKYRNQWLSVLLSKGDCLKEFAEEIGAHAESLSALYRKLRRLESFPFLTEKKVDESVINKLLENLDRGINVILEFGTHASMLCYLLVSNIITRRIHEVYVKKTEKFLSSMQKEHEPQKLVITIEEAHKFLNPQTARQTIFGIIAREMRKYYVSLLIVDQRPSGIDQEIMSQIGTKIVALLSDEKDIQSVLCGTSNSSELRGVLATLDTKKQALLMGHAVPMPIVIKTREYDQDLYKVLTTSVSLMDIKKTIDEIF
ncbi:TPA: ATPase [Candidatus Dependentiae bacterium]|nr:MAG: hypothetical protein UR14_C0003G0129 [candidate division TM6 bacterium GW2011_GWE2_31_21]KKP53707.1 MAG: hypothetical protein UR43_C0003G0028 [candidate division TM6 bacterium GW2011_GWF2_33_332]HBS48541.1 ATPase [Candidatus Dependentiae bacterium]HBZ73156.1 ATPase [Candidatus Dependentiae bacterium]